MVYDWRVGTSICESKWRISNIATANSMVGINGTSNSKKFDGRCVNTIVFKSPKRRAIAGAARNESAASKFVPKKIPPRTRSEERRVGKECGERGPRDKYKEEEE